MSKEQQEAIETRNEKIDRLVSEKIEVVWQRDHARKCLRDFPCPRPMNGDPENLSIGGCMDLQHCGCEYGVACGYVPTTMPINET